MPMEPPKVKDIFLAALEIPNPAARLAYVDSTCGTDLELRNCVRDMLVAHQKAHTPIPEVPEGPTQPETTPPLSAAATLPPGTIIDHRYKIIELIAEGGMGSVYRASRVSDMKMEVAIKLIKQGMASQQILARFNIERQALAIMKHDNIAKVLDAGTTKEGYPYFVMELVKGLPITKFCDDNKLTVNERMELFEKVCSAVQHAHQKGIVHRDLKPSNILVGLYDDKAVPKVIDFGLAKALHQPITDDILHTKFGTFVGTWQYTAPEQAILNNLDIDTRADIYSLGVILYELLTGNPPIEKSRITHAMMEEVLRIIREEEPPKPSTKIHSSEQLPSIAALRGSEPLQLERQIRGELDWIVMRALEKDRNRRFNSAEALGSDIRRYLAGEAIESGPVSWAYRCQKFVQRHRGIVLAASLILAVITIGAVVSTVGWYRAARERVRADEQTASTQAINDFLNELLSEADPGSQIKPDQAFVSNITVKAALDKAAAKVHTKFRDQPLVEASVRHAIGKAYSGLGDLKSARRQFQEAERLRYEIHGKLDPDRISSLFELGWVELMDSQLVTAQEYLEEAANARASVFGKLHQDTLKVQYTVSLLYAALDKQSESEGLVRETWGLQKQILGSAHLDTMLTQRELAEFEKMHGNTKEAKLLLEDVVRVQRQNLGDNHPESLVSLNSLGLLYCDIDDYFNAEKIFDQLLQASEAVLGKRHPTYLSFCLNRASLLILQGKYNDVIPVFEQLIKTMTEVNGPLAHDTITAEQNLATVYLKGQHYCKAEPLFLACFAKCKNVFGPKHEKTQNILEKLIMLYSANKNTEKELEFKQLLAYPAK